MLNSDFRDMLSAFCEEKVEFMLVGAYAVAAHGLPRATGDIDLWINCTPENAQRVWSALERFGAPRSNLAREDFLKPNIIVQIGVAPRRIDILTAITGVDYETARSRQLHIDIEGITIPVISLEDLIRNKTSVGRPQDHADIARLKELRR